MNRFACIRAFGAFLALATLPAGVAAPAGADPTSITVFAAASLHEAFTAAGPAFTKATGTAVTFSFAGSDSLEQQLAQGAPADVFASANESQMQKAVAAGITGSDPKTFARNRLVIVVPSGNPAKIASAADLAKSGVKVVFAAPTVPVGAYTRAGLKKLDGRPGYAADFDAAVEKNVVSNELDVKAVATKISLGEGDAGVVYATDVAPLGTKVETIAFPPDSVAEAVYPIATVKTASNAKGAQAFVDFILSPAGQAFLKARGFISP
jgi:molybdate transport system substrate-binding protein